MIARELGKEYAQVEFVEAIDQAQLNTALETDRFDVVITDFQLQWTNGLKVLHAVKRKNPNCPVVMFTATGSEEIAVEAMKSGLDEYIIKNVKHLVRLRAAVRSVLEHARLQARAERLESRLSSLLSRLKVGVFRAKSDGTLIDTNEALASLLHAESPDALAGTPFRDLFVDKKLFQTKWEEAITHGQCREFEALVKSQDGQTVWTATALVVAEPIAGEYTVEGLVEDVSEKKRTEEAFRQNEAELAHIGRLTIMGEMVAGIAHEIGQPLGAISNFSNVCIRALENGEDCDLEVLRKSTRRIAEQSIRAGEIIRGLRRFVSRQPIPLKRLELNQVLRESVELTAYELHKSRVRVDYDLSDGNPQVDGDRVQIQQVMINLLRNAVESMLDCDPDQRQILIRSKLVDERVQVDVEDRGPGLPELDRDSLFHPFITTRPGGMGMGLAISASLVTAHGGELWHDDPDNRGAVFHFTLPLARSTEDES